MRRCANVPDSPLPGAGAVVSLPALDNRGRAVVRVLPPARLGVLLQRDSFACKMGRPGLRY
jgi:hypothetical protein